MFLVFSLLMWWGFLSITLPGLPCTGAGEWGKDAVCQVAAGFLLGTGIAWFNAHNISESIKGG